MDYAKVGLKAGLEIHQQLDTGKLFCNCPGILRTDEPDFVVKRKLHAVAGETGEVDIAVEYEAALDKEFEYQGYDDTTCLIELDEEPPHPVNRRAFDEALKIALLLNCEIYPVVQIMRKTVIDGSNTSGFQRTFLIAHDGLVETSFGKVRIETIALEEDAARIVHKGEKHTIYRLDRLGIPLVEVTTKPDMNTAEGVKEAALKIGEILRACKVKRGIGTIRQDLNISIKGHDRVEIKGFQDPKMMIQTVDVEIKRQLENLKNKEHKGEVRNAKEDGTSEFLRPMPGHARMYPETDLKILKISREELNELKQHLPKLKSEIRDELKKKSLNDDMIALIVDEGAIDEFEVLMGIYSKDANLIAKMITLWRNEFASKLNKRFDEIKDILSERAYEQILVAVREGKISENDVKEVLKKIMAGTGVEDALKIEKVSFDDVECEIRRIVKEKPGMNPNAYMGIVMGKMKGKISPKEAMALVVKVLEEKS